MSQDSEMESSQQQAEDAALPKVPAAVVDAAAAPDKTAVNVNIEDIFGSDDDDDELAESTADLIPSDAKTQGSGLPSSPPAAPISSNIDSSSEYSDPEIMLAYYSRLFPFKPFYSWLNYSLKPSNAFAHREFAFTLHNDAYLRYQSYPSADLLQQDILRLNPSRFEIGPVYSTNPRDRKQLRKASSFRPISKELVFDIDMTDYDEIRTCCTGAAICGKCWAWMTMALKVIDAALREDFGYQHILWVYSGRRGIHAWVSDRRARDMDDQRRKAIAGYLNVIKGGDKSGKKVNIKRPLHPHLVRSLKILEGHFARDVLEGQDPWREEERAEKLLNLLPEKTLAEALRRRWASSPGRSSTAKWADIDKVAASGSGGAKLNTRALLEAKQDIVLEYTYPRLDAAVSLHLNHLLKSPFVVHPKTGRVCVPIDPSKVEEFDPENVPRVTEVLTQIDEWQSEHDENMGDGDGDNTGSQEQSQQRIADYQKTALKGYVELFKDHAAALLRDERGIKRERDDGDPMEF